MPSLKKLFAAAFFVLFFGGGFVTAGVVSAYLFFTEHVQPWQKTRAYVPVEAKVIAAELLQIPSKGAKTRDKHQVTATVAFDFQGEEISAGATSGSPDSLLSYHTQMHQRLKQAQESRATVRVWVNPYNPQQLVLDQDFRWLPVLFFLPFMTGFPLVGIAASAGLLWSMRQPPARPGQREKPIDGSIPLALMAAVWNLITWPFAILVLHELPYEERWGGELMVLPFALVGVFLLKLLWSHIRSRPVGPPLGAPGFQ